MYKSYSRSARIHLTLDRTVLGCSHVFISSLAKHRTPLWAHTTEREAEIRGGGCANSFCSTTSNGAWERGEADREVGQV